MKPRQMLVTVLTGTALVATVSGRTATLHAGDRQTFGTAARAQSDSEYKLVWADEFEEDGPPDPKNWVLEKGFVRNNEAQWYQRETLSVGTESRIRQTCSRWVLLRMANGIAAQLTSMMSGKAVWT